MKHSDDMNNFTFSGVSGMCRILKTCTFSKIIKDILEEKDQAARKLFSHYLAISLAWMLPFSTGNPETTM